MFDADLRPHKNAMLLELDLSGRKPFSLLSMNDFADHLQYHRHEVHFAQHFISSSSRGGELDQESELSKPFGVSPVSWYLSAQSKQEEHSRETI